jgi:hypothetical protein
MTPPSLCIALDDMFCMKEIGKVQKCLLVVRIVLLLFDG